MKLIHLKYISLRKFLRLSLIVGIAVFFFITFPFARPSDTTAQIQETNTDVFTGQIIPAFIASEYDPTEAFAKLAGATVYVFAYDTWGASSMVVSNIAIKTQLRADGTFQAMGLPHAAKYGVYFPYGDNGPTEGIRSPIVSVSGCGYDGTDPFTVDCDDEKNTTPETCAAYMCGSSSIQNTPFRAPKDTDNISSVFSYSMMYYPRTSVNPHDQTNVAQIVNLNNALDNNGAARPDELIYRRRVFVTSSNRLDIENHVNVFPVIPTSVMKFRVNNLTTIDHEPSNPAEYSYFNQTILKSPITVTMNRIATVNFGNGSVHQSYPVDPDLMYWIYVDGPTITGKTSADGDFEAYAPPGMYAVKYSYNDVFFGFVIKNVDPGGSFGTAMIPRSTWSAPIYDFDMAQKYGEGTAEQKNLLLYLYYKPLYIWGRVSRNATITGTDGTIQTVGPLPPSRLSNAANLIIYNSSRKFEGLNHTGLITNPTDYIKSDPADPDSPPLGVATTDYLTGGIYMFRLQSITGAQHGRMRLFGFTNAAETDYRTPLTICGQNSDGTQASETCDPQEKEFNYSAGVIVQNFELLESKKCGFVIKSIDLSNQPVMGARISLMPQHTGTSNSWAGKSDFPYTNSKGDSFVPYTAFSDSAGFTNINDSSVPLKDTALVVGSLGDSYSGTGVINACDYKTALDASNGVIAGAICNEPANPPPAVNCSGLSSTSQTPGNCYDKETENYVVTVADSKSLSGSMQSALRPNMSGIARLASSTKMKVPAAFAQSTTNQTTTCGNLVAVDPPILNGSYYSSVDTEPITYLRLNGTLKNWKESNVVAAFITPQMDDKSAETFTMSLAGIKFTAPDMCTSMGTTVSNCDVFTMPNPKHAGQAESGFYYDERGNFSLFLPCSTTNWSIQFKTGDRLSNGTAGTETTAQQYMDQDGMQDYHGYKELYGYSLSENELSLLSGFRNAYVDVIKLDGEIRSESQEIAVVVRGIGSHPIAEGIPNYIVYPARLVAYMSEMCPTLDVFSNLTVPNILGSFSCTIGMGLGRSIPSFFNFLEKTVLTTKSLTDTSAVVFLWDVIRRIVNVVAAVVLLISYIIIVFRLNDKSKTPTNPFSGVFLTLRAVLLANFSLVICQLFIDLNNIAVHLVFTTIQDAVVNQILTPDQFNAVGVAGIAGIGGVLGGTIISAVAMAGPSLIAILILVAFSLATLVIGVLVQFIIRYAVIWLCVILSPLVFLLGALPFGKSLTGMWNKTFFAFVFMQTGVAVILSLGLAILVSFAGAGSLGDIWNWGALFIGIAIMGIALKSPGAIAGLMGAGDTGKLMQGVSAGAQGVGKSVGQFYSSDSRAERAGVVKAANIAWQDKNKNAGFLRKAAHYIPTALGSAVGSPRARAQVRANAAEAKGMQTGLASQVQQTGKEDAIRDALTVQREQKLQQGQRALLAMSPGGFNDYMSFRKVAQNNPDFEVGGFKAKDNHELDEGLAAAYQKMSSETDAELAVRLKLEDDQGNVAEDVSQVNSKHLEMAAAKKAQVRAHVATGRDGKLVFDATTIGDVDKMTSTLVKGNEDIIRSNTKMARGRTVNDMDPNHELQAGDLRRLVVMHHLGGEKPDGKDVNKQKEYNRQRLPRAAMYRAEEIKKQKSAEQNEPLERAFKVKNAQLKGLGNNPSTADVRSIIQQLETMNQQNPGLLNPDEIQQINLWKARDQAPVRVGQAPPAGPNNQQLIGTLTAFDKPASQGRGSEEEEIIEVPGAA